MAHLIVLSNELEGLHAEPELVLVGRGMEFNSWFHVTPSQRKMIKNKNLALDATIATEQSYLQES